MDVAPSARASGGAWRVAGPLLVLAACAALLASGFAGVGRGHAVALADFDFYYAAGRCWLAGDSMYDAAAFTREMRALGRGDVELAFGYSPAFVPFSLLLGALPYGVARGVMWFVGFAGIAFLCRMAVRLAREPVATTRLGAHPATVWLMIAAVCGATSTSTALWLGQLGPWMAALLIAGWLAVQRRELVLAGIFFGLTSMKPQFSFLPLLWLLLAREWRVLGTAALTALALSSYTMALLGPVAPFTEFLGSVAEYARRADDANALGSVHVLGLPGLLTAAGVHGLRVEPFLAAVSAGVACLWLARRRAHTGAVLALLLTAHIALVYAHDIECVFLAPAWAWLWNRCGPWSAGLCVSAACFVLLSLPARFVSSDPESLVLHWRSFALLALFALVCATAWRPRELANAPAG